MDMNDADGRLIGTIMEAYSEGTPLGLAIGTGLLLVLHFLIISLGFILLSILTWLIGIESFSDDISFISYKALFCWVIGAFAVYLYRTNSMIAKWTERGGKLLMAGYLLLGVAVLLVFGVSVLSKLFGFEIPLNIFG